MTAPSSAAVADDKDVHLRMPGDILQNESGYSSSNDDGNDHFSDAPEGLNGDEDGQQSSPPTSTPAATTDRAPGESQSAVAPPPPPHLPGQAQLPRRSSALSIPGAFGTDDDDNDRDDDDGDDESTAPTSSHSPTTASTTPTTTTTVAQQQPAGDATLHTPEIVVKWNEKTDAIVPKVRGERERIERLVLEQKRARSESPSAIVGIPLSPPPPSPPQPPLQPAGQAAAADEQEEEDDTNAPQVLAMQSDDDHHQSPQPEPAQDDDFDDFGETVEADGDGFNDFDDFAGFDEGNATNDGFANAPPPPPPPPPAAVAAPPPPPSPPAAPSMMLPDFGNADSTRQTLARAVERMFPRPTPDAAERGNAAPTTAPGEGRAFLTDRSQSLWNQLVAPPPLQPPNWKISRIRRLFLVSLGIPLDLDEILPTETKQKKLVLPSVHAAVRHADILSSSRSSSRASRRSGSQARRRRRGGGDGDGEQPAAVDIPSARILCSTSTVALHNLSGAELREHVARLEQATQAASQMLTYWLAKRDGAVGDKETFETVIESLVGYAKKQRQNG